MAKGHLLVILISLIIATSVSEGMASDVSGSNNMVSKSGTDDYTQISANLETAIQEGNAKDVHELLHYLPYYENEIPKRGETYLVAGDWKVEYRESLSKLNGEMLIADILLPPELIFGTDEAFHAGVPDFSGFSINRADRASILPATIFAKLATIASQDNLRTGSLRLTIEKNTEGARRYYIEMKQPMYVNYPGTSILDLRDMKMFWNPLPKNEVVTEMSEFYPSKERNALTRLKDKSAQPTTIPSNTAPISTPGGINFTSIRLNYKSYRGTPNGDKDFGFVIKAQNAAPGDKVVDLVNGSRLSAEYFLTGLTVPDYNLWVNLNPWQSDIVISEDLGQTEMGRIMLEADLQMKKDFCKYEDPCNSSIGDVFWGILDKKYIELLENCTENYPGEIKPQALVGFNEVNRHWIVPERIYSYGNESEVYIENATMTIYSESVYNHSCYVIQNQDPNSLSEGLQEELNRSAVEYGRYYKELEEKMILPLVVRDINEASTYSDLREVYMSLALAQWYKKRAIFTDDIFSDRIDTSNLTGIRAKPSWSSTDIWQNYVKSVREGEYHCWQNTTRNLEVKKGDRTFMEPMGVVAYRSTGGVNFSNVEGNMTMIGGLTPDIRNVTTKAIFVPFADDGKNYYFGDSIYTMDETSLQDIDKAGSPCSCPEGFSGPNEKCECWKLQCPPGSIGPNEKGECWSNETKCPPGFEGPNERGECRKLVPASSKIEERG